MDETTEPATPRTLVEAHHAVEGCRPCQDAPLEEWLAFHQRAAAWYAEVAEIDRGHHHEALYMAEHQRAVAEGVQARIRPQRPTGEEEGGDGDEEGEVWSAVDGIGVS